MGYARRRCGESSLGPGFESPRLHFRLLTVVKRHPEMDAVLFFGDSTSARFSNGVQL